MATRTRGGIDAGRVLGALLQRPQVRTSGRRRSGAADAGVSFRPNAPRTVTVVAAVALTIVGAAHTVIPIPAVVDLVAGYWSGFSVEEAWMALIAAPALLVAGSFLRGL